MDPIDERHGAALTAAAQGAVVLTVNKRLSRYLRVLFDDRMRQEGRGAWKTPEILSLDIWLRRTLAHLGEDSRLLDEFSTLRLWEEVIETDSDSVGGGLLQIAATARRAMEAHQLLTEYDVDVAGRQLTEDHAAFLRWRQKYLDTCRAGDWLDPAALANRIDAALRRGEFPAPRRAFLVGFDEISPKVRRVAAALADAGCVVEEIPPSRDSFGELVRIACADVEDEVRRAARWSRHLLESGAERIGIVVPSLQSYRPYIERIFRAEIDPGALPGLDEEEARFSLSLGSKLIEQGLVTAAFEILGVGFSSSLDAISFLLRTPYLGGSQGESHRRARLDQKLRSLRQSQIRLLRLKDLVENRRGEGGKPELPEFLKICAALKDGLKNDRKRSCGEWVHLFADLLGEVGWPGERPLSSLEYQVFKAWREKLLPAMVSLEAVASPLDRSAALCLLRRLAAEIDFQPETPSGPLQVVGILEAAGLHFDHLWVMGLTDDALPAACRPNPFLPVSLQVAQGMPHASAERELDFARRIVRRLFCSAPGIVLSHPCRDGDALLRPSPLIAHVAPGEVTLAPLHSPVDRIRERSSSLEQFVDEQAPAVASGDAVSGGTGILRDQALCPFRAFAHHRLDARALDRPEIGLDAGTRGTLLHAVLELFWRKTESRDNLCALGEKALDSRIEDCVEKAMEEQCRGKGLEVPPVLLDLERTRLCALVGEWLREVDMNRTPFRVWQPEVERRETFGRLTIGTKVDRIDELGDGSRVILDYKTGRVDPADLFGERLLEPQLPVYGLGEEEGTLAGVAFAGVRRGDCSLKGVARSGELLAGIEAFAGSKMAEKLDIADWPGLLERWRLQLDGLGDEFMRGAAAVAPVDPAKACQYCDLFAFCRIDEIAPDGEETL
jgi:probable DNA repair protein